MKEYEYDLYRITGEVSKQKFIVTFCKNYSFRYLFYWRKITNKSKLSFIYRFLLYKVRKRSNIEIPFTVKMGKGIVLQHASGITINSKAELGNNITLYKGVTVGNIKRGPKSGAPTIGNNVYIGLNSTIVGNVKIGDDVLIAPNSYVNFDVPSHSIVVGSPGVIHKSEHATKLYIENVYEKS